MLDLPIVDSHVHLWDPDRFRIPWFDGNTLLDRPYGLPDFHAATAGLDVQGLVFIQAEVAECYALLEAQWVAGLAARDRHIRGIVAYAPLEFGDRARAFLEALRAVSPLIKGVRRLLQGMPVEFCLQPSFVRGVRMLAEYGLSFDLCIRHQHLANAVRLVQQCPDTRFILDHIAKPDIAGGMLDPWRRQLQQLAACPNVSCKISGVVTEANHQRWTEQDVAPYVMHTLEVFGEDRVAFGSDWPVVLQASAYRRWVETLEALTAGLPAEARRKLWAGNAMRTYEL